MNQYPLIGIVIVSFLIFIAYNRESFNDMGEYVAPSVDDSNSAAALATHLDPEIIESHNGYIADSDFLATSGAARVSVNDHDDSIIPWVGLGGLRGGNVAHSGIGIDARVTTHYTQEQIDERRERELNGIKWG